MNIAGTESWLRIEQRFDGLYLWRANGLEEVLRRGIVGEHETKVTPGFLGAAR